MTAKGRIQDAPPKAANCLFGPDAAQQNNVRAASLGCRLPEESARSLGPDGGLVCELSVVIQPLGAWCRGEVNVPWSCMREWFMEGCYSVLKTCSTMAFLTFLSVLCAVVDVVILIVSRVGDRRQSCLVRLARWSSGGWEKSVSPLPCHAPETVHRSGFYPGANATTEQARRRSRN